jgi:hypothetical protein
MVGCFKNTGKDVQTAGCYKRITRFVVMRLYGVLVWFFVVFIVSFIEKFFLIFTCFKKNEFKYWLQIFL